MITKTIKLFTYVELEEMHKSKQIGDKAMERARSFIQDGQTTDDWYEYLFKLWESALEQIGFCDADIRFSGFWSQGDGASFTGSIDLIKLIAFLSADFAPTDVISEDRSLPGGEDFRGWLVKKIAGKPTANVRYRHLLAFAEADRFTMELKRTGSRYSHSRTVLVCWDFVEGDRWHRAYALAQRLFEEVCELYQCLCRAIYESLEKEYEDLRSDEAVRDAAQANEWTFRANGALENL